QLLAAAGMGGRHLRTRADDGGRAARRALPPPQTARRGARGGVHCRHHPHHLPPLAVARAGELVAGLGDIEGRAATAAAARLYPRRGADQVSLTDIILTRSVRIWCPCALRKWAPDHEPSARLRINS